MEAHDLDSSHGLRQREGVDVTLELLETLLIARGAPRSPPLLLLALPSHLLETHTNPTHHQHSNGNEMASFPSSRSSGGGH